MNPKQYLLAAFFLLISIAGKTQSISVKSFKVLPHDMTGRVNHPVKDQNGEKCALIKVVNNQQGFVWEAGMLGIQKIERKTGEFWVYVPHGSKKITIKHDRLGVLRNYVYPEAIKEATVYEMKLTTGEVKTVVQEKEFDTQWLIIKTEPEEANVFIDGKLAGKTPFQRKYEEGEYTYRIEKSRYYNKAGKTTLKNNKKELDLSLKSRFGNIKVTSAPEDGMMIYLDDENTGKSTPDTLEQISSGEHTIKIQSRWYQPQAKQLAVKERQTTKVDFILEPVFAKVAVETNPDANIIVDGEKKGKGTWQGRLMEGIYTIKAEKAKYFSQSEQLKVNAGQEEAVNFALKGKTGKVDVVTSPMSAEVYVDGEKQGTTPTTITNLLIGKYKLKIAKEGYGKVIKDITIQEDETIIIKENLSDGKEVFFKSTPEGAKIYVDEEFLGNTPQKSSLSFGKHNLKMIHEKTLKEKEIDITKDGKDQFEYVLQKMQKNGQFTDKRDGNSYKWVSIGEQMWMAENLSYKTEKGSWCYKNERSYCDKYGRLYNWQAAKSACPEGWHLPLDEEWKTLIIYLEKLGYSKEVGKTLKSRNGWEEDGDGNDVFNFSALPAGQYVLENLYGDCFYENKKKTYWWSSTKSFIFRRAYKLKHRSEKIHKIITRPEIGFSIRCIKDE